MRFHPPACSRSTALALVAGLLALAAVAGCANSCDGSTAAPPAPPPPAPTTQLKPALHTPEMRFGDKLMIKAAPSASAAPRDAASE